MTDRELLELAAKAAGIAVDWRESVKCLCYSSSPYNVAWNPQTDDGDALRLAVTAGLFGNSALWHELSEAKTAEQVRELFVRAAAEIGKGMP